jgi:hypothetical protein
MESLLTRSMIDSRAVWLNWAMRFVITSKTSVTRNFLTTLFPSVV